MSFQVIPQAQSSFGKLLTGAAQGFADQAPKEMERYRLSEGLKNFEKDSSSLNPMQQLARLSAIPGVTPQMVQSFAELARYQNRGRAYGQNQDTLKGNQANVAPPQGNISPTQIVNNAIKQKPTNLTPEESIMQNGSQQTPIVNPREFGQPQIQNEYPLAEEALPRYPWTPQQRNSAISNYISQGFLPDEAKELAADDEKRYLSQPDVYEKRQSTLEDKSIKARDELIRQIETKLQKSKQEIYKDLTGEMISNLERGMERDLRLNPNASYKDVANDWSNRALDLSKAKSLFLKKAATTGVEAVTKGTQVLDELKQFSKIFSKTGNSEEYWNMLQSNFGLSPQASASIAYKPSKELQNYINNYRPIRKGTADRSINASTAATEVGDMLRKGDSILGIMWELTRKDPNFDQQAFLNQLREDQDELSLSNFQQRELGEGSRNILPSWSDFVIFPFFKR